MQQKYILFDFDGVIADSFAAAFEVRNLICPNMSAEHYRTAFDGNIKDWSLTGIGHDDACDHDVDFFTHYLPKLKEKVAVFPGMETVIQELAQKYTLIVISSTTTGPIQEFLKKNGLAHYVTEIMGFDVHTSKIEKMKTVFSKYKTSAEHCVFVTDTLGDIREANHMQVGSIGVTWGFQDRQKLSTGQPFKIVDKVSDLVPAIEGYFLR